jgi:transcriptional regulator with XRE-family HTH domain
MKTNPNIEADIGSTIRQVRIAKGYSLEDVAAKTNLSPNSVRALELGRGSSLSTMVKVLKALDELKLFTNWIEAQQTFSPLEALRQSRNQKPKPQRVSKKRHRL